jgi:hypothetical protein
MSRAMGADDRPITRSFFVVFISACVFCKHATPPVLCFSLASPPALQSRAGPGPSLCFAQFHNAVTHLSRFIVLHNAAHITTPHPRPPLPPSPRERAPHLPARCTAARLRALVARVAAERGEELLVRRVLVTQRDLLARAKVARRVRRHAHHSAVVDLAARPRPQRNQRLN